MGPASALDFPIVSHPTLGLPQSVASPHSADAALRLRDAAPRLAARALEVALDADPTLRDRYDETGLRERLHDAELLVERVALSVAQDDPLPAREYADWTATTYRRKRVPMDDLISLCRGLQAALPGVLAPGELAVADTALDEAAAVFKWYRRIAGDARKRNALLQFLYKGA